MSKEIVTRTWCDACADAGQQEEGTEVRLTFGGNLRAIDLCERHIKEMVEPLREVLHAHGQPIMPGAEKKPRKKYELTGNYSAAAQGAKRIYPGGHGDHWPCAECDYVAKAAGGLGAHMRGKHGVVGTSPTVKRLRTPDSA